MPERADTLPSPTNVCGFEITPVDLPTLVQETLAAARDGRGGWMLALNLDLVARSRREPEYGELLRKATLTFADGFPIVWACKKKNRANAGMPRVAGVDYTRELLMNLSPQETAIIGGQNPRAALSKLGLNPDGEYFIFDGKVEVTDAWAAEMATSLEGRKVVFLALGVPKQEKLICLLRPLLPSAIFIGVGGTFDFLAGIISRAPVWMQDRGLEWLYRLSTEPKRLWRRYLVEYPPGAMSLLRDVRARN